jgi:ABC-type multidrug transport system ATPase subunit
MKQKLGLACALVGSPDLLLLDEPSVGVDPLSRRELFAMVRKLLDQGVTVIWSTAYLDEAERCDRVLVLNAGKTLDDGPPAAFRAGRGPDLSGRRPAGRAKAQARRRSVARAGRQGCLDPGRLHPPLDRGAARLPAAGGLAGRRQTRAPAL